MIERFVKMALYEDGQLSLTRLIAVVGWVAFLAVTFYLVWHEITWANYDTFATFTAGGGSVTQIGNKLINSKYNSAPGSYKERP